MSSTRRREKATRAGTAKLTLNAKAYSRPDIFERERREVFARAWMIIGHVAEVREPGSFTTGEIGGEPVVVVRDQDGTLRAFSNICRHRAARLAEGRGDCGKVLRCPYHGWTYRLDGTLAAMPEGRGFGEDFDRDQVRLPQFQVTELGGLVWVNMDPDAPPIREWFGEEICTRFEAEYHRVHAHYDHNWKTLADNYLEGYHVPIGHPGLLRLLDYPKYAPTLYERAVWIDGPLRDNPSRDLMENLYQRFKRPMPEFPTELENQWTYVHFWPAQFVQIYPESIDIWQMHPEGPLRTKTTSILFRSPDESLRDMAVRRLNTRINSEVMDEDVDLCDGVQVGLGSMTYTRGVLNDNERAVGHFHDLLRDAVPGIDDDA